MKMHNTKFVHHGSLLLSAIILLVILGLSACKNDDDGPGENELKARELSKTWGVNGEASVIFNDLDVTSYYDGFQITFNTDYSFSTSGVQNTMPWPESGSWKFEDDNFRKIILSNGMEVIIGEISEVVLKLSFTHDDTNKGGRTTSFDGDYYFDLRVQ